MVDVVLPTPPFWLHIAMIIAGPWCANGVGWGGTSRTGRPVGPSSSAETVRVSAGGEATGVVSISNIASGSEGTAGADSFTRSKSWALTCGGADSAAGGCDVDTVRCSPYSFGGCSRAGKPPRNCGGGRSRSLNATAYITEWSRRHA